MAGLIERLTEEERGRARRALRAMTPEMRARVAGQCFPPRRGFALNHVNTRGQCILMRAFGTDRIVGEMEMEDFLPDASSYDTYQLAHINDRGWLATRAAVAELLTLAD